MHRPLNSTYKTSILVTNSDKNKLISYK